MALAWKDYRRGKPLLEVLDHCSGVKHVILIVVSGLRSDVLEEALKGGDLPKLEAMMNEMGHLRYKQCSTVFPSVTVPAQASLLTGAWPGNHEVVGNEWFSRENWGLTSTRQRRPIRQETREYLKFSVMDPGADPGLTNALLAAPGYFQMANGDLGRCRTLYEAYNAHHRGAPEPLGNHWLEDTAALLSPIHRGADHVTRLDVDSMMVTLNGLVWGIPSYLMGYLERRQYLDLENQGFDYLAMGQMLEHMRREKVPAFLSLWLPGLDGYSHRSGARQQRKYFRRGRLDHLFGQFHTLLKERGMEEDVLVCLTADHGHSDANAKRESRMREEDIYQHIRSAAGKGQTLPLTPKGRYSRGNRDATVVATLNGGSLFLYVKGEDSRQAGDGWLNRPDPKALGELCKGLERSKAVDKVFAYHSEDGYRQWWKGSFTDLQEWPAGDDYPMARERLLGLAGCGRSPDIVVSAREGFYFSRQTYQGEHGSLRAEDSHVPLIFLSGRLPKDADPVEGWVNAVNVAPTLASALSCREELEAYQDDSERMRALLHELESYRNRGPRRQWFDYGAAFGETTQKLFGTGFTRNKAEEDYRARMETYSELVSYRAERFRSRGSISEDLYLGVRDAVRDREAMTFSGGKSDEEE